MAIEGALERSGLHGDETGLIAAHQRVFFVRRHVAQRSRVRERGARPDVILDRRRRPERMLGDHVPPAHGMAEHDDIRLGVDVGDRIGLAGRARLVEIGERLREDLQRRRESRFVGGKDAIRLVAGAERHLAHPGRRRGRQRCFEAGVERVEIRPPTGRRRGACGGCGRATGGRSRLGGGGGG